MGSMTKKDFVELADYLRPVEAQIPAAALEALLAFLKAQNCRFDADLWMRYLQGLCGPGGGALKGRKDR